MCSALFSYIMQQCDMKKQITAARCKKTVQRNHRDAKTKAKVGHNQPADYANDKRKQYNEIIGMPRFLMLELERNQLTDKCSAL